MKHVMRVGLGPGYIVLDGDPATPKRCTATTIFGPCPLWPNGWMELVTTGYGGRPRLKRLCVRWDQLPQKGKGAQPPIFVPCLLWPNGWTDQDAT